MPPDDRAGARRPAPSGESGTPPRGPDEQGAVAGEEVAAEAATPPELGKRIANRRTLISFGIALLLLVLAIRGLKIDPGQVKKVIATADLKFFVVAFVAYYLSFPARSERWRLLMGNAYTGAERQRILHYPLVDLTEILYLSWFANCVVPAKLGDIYRAYLARNCVGISMSKTFGTVVAERMLDLLVLFPLLMLSTIWAFKSKLGSMPSQLRVALFGGLALAVIALVLLFVLWRFKGLISGLLPPRAAHMFLQLRSGALHSLRGNIVLPLGLTIFSWLMEGTRLYFVLASLHLLRAGELGISAAIFLALGSSVLTTLPITAGGLGVVETFLTFALANVFLTHMPANQGHNVAAAVALLDRLISYASLVVIGLVLYLFSKKTRMSGPPPEVPTVQATGSSA
ncbi:MAG: lysylphosphatidylglycerol synthase transmembrane domain-containing protein [Chloroflexota bacterium]